MTKSPLDVSFDKTVQDRKYDNAMSDFSNTNTKNNTQICMTKSMKSKKSNSLYPYLQGDKVQVLSRVMEKRLVHKRATDIVSSFPLAVSVYKANSDENTPINKVRKKAKKSVLTLPNLQAPLPQACTVSDVNESEYYLQRNPFDKKKVRKRRLDKDMSKSRVRESVVEFYDRDSLFCSRINFNTDGSSIDMIRNHKGDGKRHSKKKRSNTGAKNLEHTEKCQPHDVWAALRKMKRFQFQESPAVSIGSLESRKPKVTKGKSRNARITETCTEEYSYISSCYSLNVDDSPTLTRSSSLGRVTVIDKEEDLSQIALENLEQDVSRRRSKLIDFASRNNCKQKKLTQRNKFRTLKSIENKHNEESTNKNTSVNNTNFNGIRQSNSDCQRSISDKENELSNNSAVFKPIATKKAMLTKIISSCASHSNSDIFTNSFKSSKAELADNNAKHLVSKDTNKPDNLLSKTTLYDPNLTPNFTKTEIKSRLSRLKLPIVILGRDQVKSQIELLDYEFPQFYGLDKKVWPFMVCWMEGTKDLNVPKNSKEIIKLSPPCNLHKLLNERTRTSQRMNLKDKNRNNKSYHKKTVPNISDAKKITNKVQKPRNEKGLQLIDNYEATELTDDASISENKYKIDTHIKIGPYIVYKAHIIDAMDRSHLNNRIESNCYPCTKAKRAKLKNDSVQNVISKISKGVYYSQDNNKYGGRPTATFRETVEFVYSKRMTQWNNKSPLKDPNLSGFNDDLRDSGIQVGTTSVRVSNRVIQTSSSIEKLFKKKVNKNLELLNSIPGFNSGLTALQIDTYNTNQISIKNIATNIKVKFDIKLGVDAKNIITKEVPYLIPLEVTKSNTKIYKCQTTIVNAMLPGELCSVLSDLMNGFMGLPSESDSLSTISENKSSSISFTNSLRENFQPLRKFLSGDFSENNKACLKTRRENCPLYTDTTLNPKLLLKLKNIAVMVPGLKCNEVIFRNLVHQYNNLSSKHKPNVILPIESSDENTTSSCNKIDIYRSKNKLLTLPSVPLDYVWISDFMKNCNLKIDFKLSSYLDLLNLKNADKELSINVTMKTKDGDERSLVLRISNTNVICATGCNTIDTQCSLSNVYEDNVHQVYRDGHENNNNAIECDKIEKKCNGIIKSKSSRKRSVRYKLRRKSTYILPCEKKSDTLLSNVSSVEDFFQILGPKKSLANVFDGYVTKRILSSLTEMKNWTTGISPQQAILILLLTNKKQSVNLVRFRPILLQGIAVKRITRSSELDTEIEVIERENLNKIYQCEGISYLPESTELYDNLMEELYWIAKTTASDYQRPFDESSEKLLKSLVEKRKQLNPSYLRVMARYVGLGLLKSPKK